MPNKRKMQNSIGMHVLLLLFILLLLCVQTSATGSANVSGTGEVSAQQIHKKSEIQTKTGGTHIGRVTLRYTFHKHMGPLLKEFRYLVAFLVFLFGIEDKHIGQCNLVVSIRRLIAQLFHKRKDSVIVHTFAPNAPPVF